MKEKAIMKIKREMENAKNPYVQVVGEYLLKEIKVNPGAAEKIFCQNKTIIKSLQEMRNIAFKRQINNCAILTDEEGFKIVRDYFEIRENKEDLREEKVERKVIEVDFDVNLEDLI